MYPNGESNFCRCNIRFGMIDPYHNWYDLYCPAGIDGKGKKWRHEDGSVEMFRYLRADNDIDLSGEYGFDAMDITFIEEIIAGTRESERQGREKSKFFLYGVWYCNKLFVDQFVLCCATC